MCAVRLILIQIIGVCREREYHSCLHIIAHIKSTHVDRVIANLLHVHMHVALHVHVNSNQL